MMAVVQVNGFALNYEQVGAGAPLVYIAGTRFDSAKMWVPYMQRHAEGFQVLLPDPRGMAGSQHVASVKPSDWVADLAGLLDSLGLAKVHLAAETFGSRIATRFAADYPNRVSSLILNGVIAYSSPGADEERARNSDPANIPEDRRRSLEEYHGADWVQVNAFYLNVHGQPEFHAYYDLRQVAPRVSAPTLLVRGDVDDPIHPVRHSVELHELLPNSWLAIYPKTEFNALRARPEEAWALIRRFTQEMGG
ncbi:MAG TPA: alpha/beta hydrolase [Chloroflexota bacterium]|jgi:pimeloyl-ACP methyl ester carboxylesterase